MRAAVVTRFGGPEVFELAELPDPVPGPGQVAIDVAYAAVGLIDIYIRKGVYKDRPGLPQPPYVPGLEVAGTARRSSLAAARASALPYDEVIASEDLRTALGGQRFDVVIDPVGGQVRTDSLKVMAPLGRMLLVGNASGDWEHTVATNDLWFGSLAIAGFSSGYYFPAHPEQAQPAARGAINAVSQGLVDIRTQVFPLAEAGAAQRRAETGSVAGRILLGP